MFGDEQTEQQDTYSTLTAERTHAFDACTLREKKRRGQRSATRAAQCTQEADRKLTGS